MPFVKNISLQRSIRFSSSVTWPALAMNLRNLAILGALCVLLGGAWMAQRQYDRAPEVAAGKWPSATLEATDLLQEFMDDEVAAGKRYTDEVIEVNGTVRGVSAPQGGKVSVLLETGNPLAAVVCEFDQSMSGLVPGSMVTVKGYCAGYNLDVVLQRCALVE